MKKIFGIAVGIAVLILVLALAIPVLAKQPYICTLDDNGERITLHEKDFMILDLGTSYYWTVTVDNPSIISGSKMGVSGKYLFTAHKSGSTTLTATGDPKCRQSIPACGMPSRMFQVYIDVIN